jgi:hypothetical protein
MGLLRPFKKLNRLKSYATAATRLARSIGGSQRGYEMDLPLMSR